MTIEGDEKLRAEAIRAFDESGQIIGLRGLYYKLVREGILLNLDDEWQRLISVVYTSPLVGHFRWKPLAPGDTLPQPDLS